MIQLCRGETYIDSVPGLAREFADTGCATLPEFLSPPVLEALLRNLADAQFVGRNEIHRGEVFGTTDRIPGNDPFLYALRFLLNRRDLFEAVERITGCPAVGDLECRLHRTSPNRDHQIDWHNDAAFGRIVGLNINLGTKDHRGGLFELRGPDGAVCRKIKHERPGDAFLFRIDASWTHRLTPLESGERTVAVGWFRMGTDWFGGARAWLRADNASGRRLSGNYLSSSYLFHNKEKPDERTEQNAG